MECAKHYVRNYSNKKTYPLPQISGKLKTPKYSTTHQVAEVEDG